MKTSDIDVIPVLNFLANQKTPGIGISTLVLYETVMPGIPTKLKQSVMKKLIKRGLVDGCACGCRGDFTITEQGRLHTLDETLHIFV